MNYNTELAEIKKNNLYRTLNTISAQQDKETIVNGKPVLLFSSNNYLGLSGNEKIKSNIIEALSLYGTGSGGSRLTTGNYELHTQLEALLSEFKGSQDSIVFNCGYMANLGTISTLCSDADVIFSDELNHASIIDGCRLSKCTTVVYSHNNIDDLISKITAIRPQNGMIVTDGVFSMDGDIVNLPGLAQVAHDHHLTLMVDDAHATGVIGKTGRGSIEHFGLSLGDVGIIMGTLSKAIASEGGFICGEASLCDYLRNSARSFIFSTSLSPATTAASISGLRHIMDNPVDTLNLQKNIAYFVERLNDIGIESHSQTAIIPIMIGDEAKAKFASQKLFDLGVFIPCIRYPTVKKGQARLRLTLMSTHTRSDMDYAIDCLCKVLE